MRGMGILPMFLAQGGMGILPMFLAQGGMGVSPMFLAQGGMGVSPMFLGLQPTGGTPVPPKPQPTGGTPVPLLMPAPFLARRIGTGRQHRRIRVRTQVGSTTRVFRSLDTHAAFPRHAPPR